MVVLRKGLSTRTVVVLSCGWLLAASGCGGGDDGGDSPSNCTAGVGPGCLAVAGSGGAGLPSGGASGSVGLGGGGAGVASGAAGTSGVGGAGGMIVSGGGSGGSAGAAGTGGVPAGGGAGAGGAAAPPAQSAGCGKTDFPADGTQMLDVDGTMREFIVALPDGYDPNLPLELIFAWHGLGGTAQQIAGGGFSGFGFYGLEARAEGSAIFVAGQGLDTSNQVGSGPGWDNMGGRDVAFTRAMLEHLRASYCIDNERIFSVGMSYGGIMSNTVGCQLGDDFRAIAPMAGSGPRFFGGGGACVGQVAAWLSHGNTDTVVSFESGQGSRDHWIESNHCDASMTQPSGSNGCLAYQGCDAGLPVVWCEFDGGHTVPGFASEEIWAFFSQF